MNYRDDCLHFKYSFFTNLQQIVAMIDMNLQVIALPHLLFIIILLRALQTRSLLSITYALQADDKH